jgi:glucan biosynthesis protein C
MTEERAVVSSRLGYIDNIRILLTTLVILHHAAATYGAPGSWYYIESKPGLVTFALFSLFIVTNQAFFMGLFFMLGGFFTPASYDRKGTARFLKERFLRLGIPIVFYILIIDPLLSFFLRISVGGFKGSFVEFLRQYLHHYRSLHVGPLWFTQNLLLFVLVYVLYRQIAGRGNSSSPGILRKPTTKGTVVFILILSLVTFIVRMRFPVMRFTDYVNVQFAHFSQYASLFIAGIIAYRSNWLVNMPISMAKKWFGIVLFFVVVIFPVMFALGGAKGGNIQPYLGGFCWQAFCYAVWEQFVGVGMITGLLSLFYNKFNHQEKLFQSLAFSCYTAYIIHPIVLVLIAIAIRSISLHPLLKFLALSVLAVPLCFALANIIRQLPLAKRIL